MMVDLENLSLVVRLDRKFLVCMTTKMASEVKKKSPSEI
jgi:hypothetical protein